MNRRPVSILHISPHFGGGVGTVLLDYLIKTRNDLFFNHSAICLDYANKKSLETAKEINLLFHDNMAYKKKEILHLISKTDIVVIHWWNHPLLYDFLVRTKLPPCRLIIWSHTLGFYPPSVFTKKILQYPDIFVFTTPISLETREVEDLTNKQRKSLRVVWATGGVEHVKSVKPLKHKDFNIGYIGTVDYAKLHPNFLNICRKVNIPNVKFIVCGGPREKEIKKEAEKLGIAEKFNFVGSVSDITKYLSIFDIFGYSLAPYHYGTCDQSLQESMAAGVVPVVLANPMESYMVKDKVTGIVAKDEKEYIKALQDLYYNTKLRNLLSKNTKEYAMKTFSLEKMIGEWNKIFKEVLTFPKTTKRWRINKRIKDISAKDVFLESLGDYGKDFVSYCKAKNERVKKRAIKKIRKLAESAIWKANTRGTVHHYNSFFSNDEYLSLWSKLMSNYKYNEKDKVCDKIP